MNTPLAYPATLVFQADDRFLFGRGPILRRLPDGTLFCTIYSGGPREPDPDNMAICVKSHDDGETWSKPEIWMKNNARPCLPGEVTVLPEGTVGFVTTYNPDCYYREARIHLTWLRPDGSWTEPYSLPGPFAGQMAFGRGIPLAEGRWLWPTFFQETLSGWDMVKDPYQDVLGMTHPTRCGVLISGDGGKTFTHYGRIIHDAHSLMEPTCVALTPDHIVMLMRTEYAGQLHRSDSRDGGLTWSAAMPTGIPNPNSKPEMLKVGSSVVLLHNPNPNAEKRGPNRMPLALWVSNDGMESWHIKMNLSPDNVPFYYSSAYADDAQQILYIVTENSRQHYLMKIPYADLGL